MRYRWPRGKLARGRRALLRRAWLGLAVLFLGAATACAGPAAPASSGRGTAAAQPAAKAATPSGGSPSASRSSARPAGSVTGAPARPAPSASAPLAGGALLIADRYNHRLLLVDEKRRILWSYRLPAAWAGSQAADGPDDAFFTPGYATIITNAEDHHVIVEIDPETGRVLWHYGHPGVAGSAPGYLNGPDDAYRLSPAEARLAGVPAGTTTVADIRNCRILFVAPDGRVVRQYGTTGACLHRPPRYLASPNGDTPLPDGGMLVTEIGGSHVLRLSPQGKVLWDLKLPGLVYPSDAQLLPDGSILVAGYTDPGQVLQVTPAGKVLWRYAPASGSGRLRQPSLAIRLPNGFVAVNDDANHRVVVIDPRSNRIVWQFGQTGVPGNDATHLNVPDGMNWVPASVATRLAASGQAASGQGR
ncbi:MAG: PQQ-binding-like beta-propeller repeat protein [Bacillota bacterium]|nr:PQQ-binding-like beta-propeller repeat protein [Bacillota bacterium]